MTKSHGPEAWETNAPGPFLSIGDVSVYALGRDRFRVESPDGPTEIAGFEQARKRAHELAA